MEIIWERLQQLSPEIERESEYGQAWTRGMQALGQAQEASTLEVFETSALAFLEALKHKPNGHEAMIGLAYWLILMGDELSAIHYARKAKEMAPTAVEAQELLDLLESSYRLTSLLDDVERLSQGAGMGGERPSEMLSKEEASELVSHTELLLRMHHLLLRQELEQGAFLKLEHLHSRQLSLEALHQLLTDHLSYFLEDPHWRKQLQQRLEVLSYDLESLGKLEAQFDHMHRFQKDVQLIFRDLTREIIRLRMKGQEILSEAQYVLIRLELKRQKLEKELDKFEPEPLRKQVEAISGWEHLLQQLTQFRQMVQEHSPQD